jgi:hypothetical protein
MENFEERRLRDRGVRRQSARVRRGALVVGLMLLAGCHARNKVTESKVNDTAARDARFNTTSPVPGRKAELGRDSITTECEHESYANASKGLIVKDTGLHEDVFSLRDRASLAANAYNLNETLGLEALLREEAKVAGHSGAQADCIDEFAEHFETLADSLVQADKVQKELDISAFNEATRQADDLLEKQSGSEQPGAKTPR